MGLFSRKPKAPADDSFHPGAKLASACPMGYGGDPKPATAAAGPTAAGTADAPTPLTLTDYERYMGTSALLQLQKAEDVMVHHDELMFQVVHQSFELWCKLILFELRAVGKLLDDDRLVEAYPLIERCTDVIKLQTDAIHVLERMTPMDFHVIRAALGQGSGAESPGFRQILADAPKLWPHVDALLRRRKTDLLTVYTKPASDPTLLRLLEHLTDFDMFFQVWRLNHLAMVKRIIGRDVKSLKGYAVHQLETDVQMTLWPPLWKVRNQVTEAAGTSPK